MSKKSWYKRKHQFTPYTKADGQAVSDEFDAIQTSFERIPEMRDDGKGFKESPLIPEPTDPMHPVPLKMLTETEKSVNNARDDVTTKAQQVAQNTQSVATNTLTATQKADTATQAAASAQSSQQAASNSENMAHKWAANPVNEVVQDNQYSAYHYATKAAQSETTASSAAITSKNNADIATSKAEEAAQSAERARSIADGEVEYEKILNVPNADITKAGIVRLTDDTGLDSDKLGLTAKAGKKLAQLIATVQLALNNYIPLNKRSSAVNSNDENNVATSKAVKTAYDKGVEAKTAADAAQRTANDGVSKADAAQTSANAANNNANDRVPKTGDTTINGILRAKNTSGGWSAYQFETSQGYWQLEVHPNSHEAANRRFNMLFNPNTGNRVYLSFPALGDNGDTVAYRSWVEDRTTPWNKIDGKPAFATRWPNAVEQGYSHSLGRTGWTKLPSGLIIQWGEMSGLAVHKFPIAFNHVGQVFVCDRSYVNDAESITVRDVNNTSFRAWARNDMGSFLFFAIGS